MADEVSNKLLSGLNRIGLAMRSAAWGDATESGLTPTQSQILGFIAARFGAEPPIGRCGRRAGHHSADGERSNRRPGRQGLVQKVPDASDRRASSLKLTRQGEVAARVAAQWPDFLLSAGAGSWSRRAQAVPAHPHQDDPAACRPTGRSCRSACA
jgi:DNA-binding MarR family transcriptional regulator